MWILTRGYKRGKIFRSIVSISQKTISRVKNMTQIYLVNFLFYFLDHADSNNRTGNFFKNHLNTMYTSKWTILTAEQSMFVCLQLMCKTFLKLIFGRFPEFAACSCKESWWWPGKPAECVGETHRTGIW